VRAASNSRNSGVSTCSSPHSSAVPTGSRTSCGRETT
jgi:hypothetical protein